MDQNNTKPTKLKGTLTAIAALSILGLSSAAFASNPTTGKLVIINSLGVVVNGSAADSASAVKVEVKDSTGVCSTTASLAYGGVVTVTWDAAFVHSATKCTDVTSVDVTPLKTTSSGKVQYDSTATTTLSATATAPTNFVAPTTPIANLVLIVTGGTSAAMVNSATSWGSALGVAPIYSAVNGSLATTGTMGGAGISGLMAAKRMLSYGIMPAEHTPLID